MPAPARPASPRPRRRAPDGFTLIEVLIGTVVIAVALMGHMASTFAEYKLARVEQARSEVLHVARQFVERLRSDDDWAGLYGRLRQLQVLAEEGTGTGDRLEDGRLAWRPEAYYQDFVLSEFLSTLVVLVDVPFDPLEPTELRENLVAPRFGLPADLDGNGVVDGESRLADYRVLPVVVTFRWRPNGDAAHELRVATWLRGYR